MRAINHALTGTLIGLTVSEPLIAVPAAIVSHYVCDAIPHHGGGLPERQELQSKLFRNLLYLDVVLCFALVVVLAVRRPQHWLLAIVCAFAAAAPDWLSFNRYRAIRSHRPYRPGRYVKFASAIQWFERPIGAVVEVTWFVAMLLLIAPLLR